MMRLEFKFTRQRSNGTVDQHKADMFEQATDYRLGQWLDIKSKQLLNHSDDGTFTVIEFEVTASPITKQTKWKELWENLNGPLSMTGMDCDDCLVAFYHGKVATRKFNFLHLKNCKISNIGTAKDGRIHFDVEYGLSITDCTYVGNKPIYFGDPMRTPPPSRTMAIDGLTNTADRFADVNLILTKNDTIKNLMANNSEIVVYGYRDAELDLDALISGLDGKKKLGSIKTVNCVLASKRPWWYCRSIESSEMMMTTDPHIENLYVKGQWSSNEKAYKTLMLKPIDCVLKGMEVVRFQGFEQDPTMLSVRNAVVETNRFDGCKVKIVPVKFQFAQQAEYDPERYWSRPDGIKFIPPTFTGEPIFPIHQSHMKGCDIEIDVPEVDNEMKTMLCLTEYINVEGMYTVAMRPTGAHDKGAKVFPLRFSSENRRAMFGVYGSELDDAEAPKPNRMTVAHPERASVFKYYYATPRYTNVGRPMQPTTPMPFWLTTAKSSHGMPVTDQYGMATINGKGTYAGAVLIQSAVFSISLDRETNLDTLTATTIVDNSESAIDQFIHWLSNGTQTATVTGIKEFDEVSIPHSIRRMMAGERDADTAIDMIQKGNAKYAKFCKLMAGYEGAFMRVEPNAMHGNVVAYNSPRAYVPRNDT